MRSIQPVPFVLAAILCFNGLHVAQAQRIRGRAIEASASYSSEITGTGASSPQASSSVKFGNSSTPTSQTSTYLSGPPARSSASMPDDSLRLSSSLPTSSAYGDSETSTTAASSLSTTDSFPSLVLPPESRLAALPPPEYQPATIHTAGSDTSPSFVSGPLATAGSSLSVVSSSVHPGFNGTVVESNAIAATNQGSAVSGFVPAQSTGLIPSHPGVSGGFQPQINSTASRFVPAFPTGIAPLHPGISGAPALGLGKRPLALNATRTIDGTAYVQSTFNVISPSGCTNFFGGPCFRPPLFVKKPPVFLHPAIALLPSTSTPTSPQQTALTDTQPSQSAVAPAPVEPPVPVQSQTAVDIGVAAMSFSPVIHGKEPAPVATQPSLPTVSNVATQPQVIQPAPPVISPVPGSLAVMVGGQTLANNGPPAVIGGQTARVTGGSIYVGTSTEPVPHAQLPQNSLGPDLIADSLTFAALPGNPTAKRTPPSVVVGGLTFSAALTNTPGKTNAVPVQPNAAPAQPNEPPVQTIAVPIGSNAAPAQPNSLPVVLGGVTYAPVQPAIQAAANNINVPPGGTGSTLEQPKAIPGSQTSSGGTNPGPGSGNTVAGQPGQEGSLPAPPNPILPLGNTIPGQSGQLPGSKPLTQGEGNTPMAQANPTASQANNAPIVLGGTIYTPVPAQPSAQAANAAPLDLVNTAGGKTQPATQPLIENGVTMPVQGVVPAPTLVGIVGGQTIYRQGSTAVVGSQTVAQGSAPILVDNTPVALGPSAIVVGTNTIALPPANPQVTVTPIPVGVVGGQTIYRQGSTAIVGSQTIAQGAAPVSVDNTPVVLGPSAVVIGTNAISLAPTIPQIDTASTSVGIVGGQTIYHQGSSAVIGSQTVVQGSAPVTIDSTPVALGPSAIVLGTNTIPLPPVNAAVITPAVYSFGGIAITQGGAPVTISGTAYSLGPSFVVEGTKTIPLSAATPSNAVLTIAGQTISANPTGFSISGTSVMPNGPAITISGTVISLNSSGVVVGSSTKSFPSPAATSSVLTIGSQTFTALPAGGGGGYEIDHSTLLPGSSAVVISGTTYSLNPASSLVIGTSTIPLATAGPSPHVANGALTAGGEAFTPLGSTAVLINGATLSLSGPAITDNGTVLSLASGGIVVGSSTYAYATPTSNAAVTTTSKAAIPSVFTVDGDTFTASGKGLAIDGTQVFQGSSAVFISGTPISLGSTGLVIGTSTVPLASVTGLGPALSGGLGSPTPTTSVGSGAASVRDGGQRWRGMILWAAVMGFMTISV